VSAFTSLHKSNKDNKESKTYKLKNIFPAVSTCINGKSFVAKRSKIIFGIGRGPLKKFTVKYFLYNSLSSYNFIMLALTR